MATSSEHLPINEATRTALAEATLIEILHRMNLKPLWDIAGMGAAEAKAELDNGIAVRITIGVEETNDSRMSVMQAAMAHRSCERLRSALQSEHGGFDDPLHHKLNPDCSTCQILKVET
jgi:hypothetical protein